MCIRDSVYTPQVVVNGSAHVIGSDRAGIESAINTTDKSDGVMSVPVTMTQSGKEINVSVAASGRGPAAMHGEVWICSISKTVPISIGRGENSGRQVNYHNVVPVSYTHLRAHETRHDLVCRL